MGPVGLGSSADPIAALRDGLIGEGAMVEGVFGPQPLIYADYTASGRALRQIEAFVMGHVLPYYATAIPRHHSAAPG